MHKAFFIDRDGVVNSDEGHYYIYKPSDFVFNPDIALTLSYIKKAGYKLVLITNQGGVAKGIYSIEDVEDLHQYMQDHLQKEDAQFDAIYYCPHHSDISECDCRKPKPGMILSAIKDLNIDRDNSIMIGDSDRDVIAGEAAGLKKSVQVAKNNSIYNIVREIIESEQ